MLTEEVNWKYFLNKCKIAIITKRQNAEVLWHNNALKAIPQKFNLRTKQNFVKHMHYNSVSFIFSRVSGSSNWKWDFLCFPVRHFQCLWNHPIERRISEIPNRRHYTEMKVKSELRQLRRKSEYWIQIYSIIACNVFIYFWLSCFALNVIQI